ncbi:hypothetical protein J6590_089307 [Homalodisca vitripennis]|nr:hypothetical protein J6590_089307 [Homalodisca vitripennis]
MSISKTEDDVNLLLPMCQANLCRASWKILCPLTADVSHNIWFLLAVTACARTRPAVSTLGAGKLARENNS